LEVEVAQRWAILVPLLIVIAIIQVLPQVDLPDTAFHENTAPIVVKSRAIAAPILNISVARKLVTFNPMFSFPLRETSSASAHLANRPLPILLSVLIC
jgi:hypothetical protein